MRFFLSHSLRRERSNEKHGVQRVCKTKVIIMALCNAYWRLNLFICIPPKSSHAEIAPFACNEHKISRTPLSHRPHGAVEEFFFQLLLLFNVNTLDAPLVALYFSCVWSFVLMCAICSVSLLLLLLLSFFFYLTSFSRFCHCPN